MIAQVDFEELADLRNLLREFGLRPKKELGQNFLIDKQAMERIVAAAELTSEDVVLEVGAGLGRMTRLLAEKARRVVAVELDERLVEVLKQTLSDLPNVEIVQGDILEFDPAELFPSSLVTHNPYKVVGNLPYYITSPILRHFLEAKAKPKLMVVTVQEEVAQRIVAQPGEMSLLAVSVQFYGRPEVIAHIKAGAFYPSPEVNSAVVHIDLYERPLIEVEDVEGFFEVVRAGFSQRRKQLHNSLSAGLGLSDDEVKKALRRAGVDSTRRAQTLSVEEWGRVWKQIK